MKNVWSHLQRQLETNWIQGIGNSPGFTSTGLRSNCNKVLTLQPLKSTLSTQTTFIFHESHILFTYTFITFNSICHTCSKNLLTAVSFLAELLGGRVISLRGLWDTGQHTLILCFSLKDVVGVLQQHQLNKNCSGHNTLDTWMGTPHCPKKSHLCRDTQHRDCKAVLHS